MIISHDHKYIFVQTPHTGCTAVAKELCENYGGQEILWKHAMFHHLGHRHPEIDTSEYFVFSSIRNPYTEIVSLYNKLKNDHEDYSNPANWQRNGGWLSERGLKQFRYIYEENASFGDYLKRFCSIPVVNWSILDHKRFDHVMRFESLGSDFASVIDRIGLPLVRELPVVNRTEKKPLDEIVNCETTRKQLVYSLSPLMQYWDYDFPPTTGLHCRVGFVAWSKFQLSCCVRRFYWRSKK